MPRLNAPPTANEVKAKRTRTQGRTGAPVIDQSERAQAEAEAAATQATQATQATLSSLFQPLHDVREFVNVLYYGKEGSGKTSAVSVMSKLGRILVINAEGGLKTAPLRSRGADTSNILVYPPAGEDLTFDGLEAVVEQLRHDLRDDPDSWAGVIVDSATEVYAACLEAASDKRVTTARNTKGVEVDRWFTDRADYGEANKQMRFLLRRLRDLPCHFAVTALERRDVDEDTQKVNYGPAVSPGLATDLLGYMDLVLVTKGSDEKGGFRALTKGTGRYRAKDRFDVLPAILQNPTFDRVNQYVTGELVEADDEQQDAQATATQTTADKAEDDTTPTKKENN